MDLEIFRVLAERSPVESRLQGRSMGSALADGARIRIRPIREEELRRGQVIAFLGGSRVMVHRIVHRGSNPGARPYLITQGDGNWLCDPPIRTDVVAGAVERYCSRRGGWTDVEPAQISWMRRAFALPFFLVLRGLLEASPESACRLANAMTRIRMAFRAYLPGRVTGN
jgi:hypothetical protein